MGPGTRIKMTVMARNPPNSCQFIVSPFVVGGKFNHIARLEPPAYCANPTRHVNDTLFIQEVLDEPGWRARMTAEDWRGLTPLIYHHINPYGRIELDMVTRLALAA